MEALLNRVKVASVQGDRQRVAICGIGLRLPGSIRSTNAFWDFLIHGKDARGPIPASRYNVDGFDASLGDKGAIKTQFGYFLEDDLFRVDASFFSMSKDELGKCDPQQRQLLEVTRECLEDAGEIDYRARKVGCYVGTYGEDWLRMSARESSQHASGYVLSGHLDLMLANRVSYEYDFKGPSLVIKTGCSASLIALHEACRALQNGDADSAVVAGTSLITTPAMTAELTAEGILSPTGSCKTFDAEADGFARAEAISAIYIKPLEVALRDGNPIRAVICGTGTNSNGRSASMLSPNGRAHEELMRHVYASAGLDPRSTAFVECHGTGTRTGDPIEASAVGRVFGGNGSGILIGSVKPNIGHSEGAAGLSSLIKCVLMLEHKTVPPNIKMQHPNPRIPFARYKLKVPLEPTPFPPNRAERVSINSFGIGGANAHVILESFRPTQLQQSGYGVYKQPTLLVFSANTQDSLQQQIRNHEGFAQQHAELAPDVAYTRAFGRERLPHRGYAVAEKGQFTVISIPGKSQPSATSGPSINIVFSGQGAQWPGMGKELIETDAVFRRCIDEMDRTLQGLRHPPSWTIRDELQKSHEESRIGKAELAQPLSTALQIALFARFDALGLRPGAVVGHSSGEIAAAYAAGVLSLSQAITLAYYRGHVMGNINQTERTGAMAAIGLGAQDVVPYIKPTGCDGAVVVACENSPSSITISGPDDVVDAVLAVVRQKRPDVLARKLKVDMAYHSPDMISPSHEYGRLVEEEWRSTPHSGRRPTVAFYSSVTGKLTSDSSVLLSPSYWTTNLTSPVRFSSAVTELLTHGNEDAIFLEIGPHSTLAGPLREICAASSSPRPCRYIASLVRSKNSAVAALAAVGELYKEGVPLDLAPLFPPGSRLIAGLPPYPWDRSNGAFWHESRVSRAWRTRRYAHHCLLGVRVPETPDTHPQWRNLLHLEDEMWVVDHKVNGDVVFPFAGYVAMAGEAVRQMVGGAPGSGYCLRDVVAHAALLVAPSEPVEMVTVLQRPRGMSSAERLESTWFDFSITSYSGSSWIVHCDGQISASSAAAPDPSPSPNLFETHTLPRQVDIARFYDAMAKVGIAYGPEFRPLANVTASPTECIAAGQITDPANHRSAPFTLHPAAIDAALQLLIVASAKGLPRNFHQLVLPTRIEHLEVHPHSAVACPIINARAVSSGRDQSTNTNTVECVAASDDAQPVLTLCGLRFTPLGQPQGPATVREVVIDDIHAAARLQWLPHFDFADVSKLFTIPPLDRQAIRMQEELALLAILETAERIEGLVPCQPHFAKFRDWLHKQIGCARAGQYALAGAEWPAYVALPREIRLALLEERYQSLLGRTQAAVAVAIKRVCDNVEELLTGKKEILDVLMEGNVLRDIYNVISFGYADFVRLLVHTRPDLRILEVGAGTGGTTEPILRALSATTEEGAPPLYSAYTFTDISAGFFPRAKERFAYAHNMEFKVLDITQPPLEQGFDVSSYDLILAPNVIHATPCLKESLGHLRQLLRPDGMLVMTELCPVTRALNYIFGNFPGWWLGEADGRLDEPFISVDRWNEELKAAGFTGVEVAVQDEEEPYQISATILSKKLPESPGLPAAAENKVTVLASRPNEGVAASLAASLSDSGWDVLSWKLGTPMPAEMIDRDAISCLDMEDNFFADITPDRFAAFQELLCTLKDQTLLWLTKPAQIQCKDPRAAAVIGVARTVRSELSLRLCTLEIEPEEAGFERLVLDVFSKVRKEGGDAERNGQVASDKEFAVHNGVVCVGRYQPFSLTRELRASAPKRAAQTGGTRLVRLQPDAAYLLVGGVGGLGRCLATWLVERGARYITLLSRSAGITEQSKKLMVELKAMGCGVVAIAGNVSNMADVQSAVLASGRPIAGVFQLAMVLEDKNLFEMTYDDWMTATKPKINGTWNLHHALQDQPLDFFWMASSLFSALEHTGQGNYVAGNTFMEAFCQYRRSRGQPASVLNICAIDGVGFVAGNPRARRKARAQGISFLGERELLDFVELGIQDSFSGPNETLSAPASSPAIPWTSTGQILMGLRSETPLDDPASRTSWRRDRRMGAYHNVRDASGSTTVATGRRDPLKAFMNSLTGEEDEVDAMLEDPAVLEMLALETGRKIYDLTLKPGESVDISLGLAQMGVDSLVATELRRWLQQTIGLHLNVLEITRLESLAQLGKLVAAKLREKQAKRSISK